MKFLLANWGTRGEVEPFVALGRELVRRGHDVRMAVAPEMVGFAESAGPSAVAYGPALRAILDPHRDFWTCLYSKPWKVLELGRLLREVTEPVSQCRGEVSKTLMSLADGSDLILTGMNFEDIAANVAEYSDVPLATLQIFPLRANSQLLPFLPTPLCRSAMTALEWYEWVASRKVKDDAERRELGLPKAPGPWTRRIAQRGTLEIQAYDEVCYPGLAAEWAKWNGQRPFVGALTMELPTDTDEDVASWIAAGKPPICFGFGSVGVESAADTLGTISAACAKLGERALICAAGTDFNNVSHLDHVKVVGVMNYAAALPSCRAFVHHGGAGTTNAGLRAGLPTLVLWTLPDQAAWGARVKRLKVGAGRRFSATTEESLIADLRQILDPQYRIRARELASRMTKSSESIATAVDLVESYARLNRVA
jgi:UDP:flavonoid glycosyltransferase YjiC (YdhE family)